MKKIKDWWAQARVQERAVAVAILVFILIIIANELAKL